MSDILISKVQELPKPAKVQPAYLILFNPSGKGGACEKLIAVKMDEGSFAVKAVGLPVFESPQDICASFQDLLRQADKSLFVELTIPWHNIIKIQSLIYRHK